MILSITPALAACTAGMGSPETIMASAASVPMSRGKRLPQARRQRCLTEFRDISSCHERTTFARKDADFDFRVPRKIGDPRDHGYTYGDADGVDRWVVDPDDADVAALFESTLHDCLQRGSLCFSRPISHRGNAAVRS